MTNEYSTDLVELMRGYGMELKPLGTNKFVTYCKWHKDTGTPNLVIYPETNSAYCFACCTSVTPVDVIMLFENVGFTEATKRLYGSGYEWRRIKTNKTLSNDADINYMYKILSRNIRSKFMEVIGNPKATQEMRDILLKHIHTKLAADKLYRALKEIKMIGGK